MKKIRLVVEIEEYYRDGIIRYRDGTYGAQLPFCVVSSALEAIANGTPYNPSGDYISRSALLNQIDATDWSDVRLLVEDAPTVPLPDFKAGYKQAIIDGKTNFARPQGEWELHGMIYYCSECGHDCGESGDNFCGNCGADMRKGAKNECDCK